MSSNATPNSRGGPEQAARQEAEQERCCSRQLRRTDSEALPKMLGGLLPIPEFEKFGSKPRVGLCDPRLDHVPWELQLGAIELEAPEHRAKVPARDMHDNLGSCNLISSVHAVENARRVDERNRPATRDTEVEIVVFPGRPHFEVEPTHPSCPFTADDDRRCMHDIPHEHVREDLTDVDGMSRSGLWSSGEKRAEHPRWLADPFQIDVLERGRVKGAQILCLQNVA